MRTLKLTFLIFLSMFTFSCNDDDPPSSGGGQAEEIHHLTPEMLAVRNYVPVHAVIAHRGTSYWAPESTEAAYRWARNIGADYLEADLQITKDGVILVMHDDVMTRTTNIRDIYPDRATDPASTFTYEELMKLDAGTWFNSAYPDRARPSYSQQHQYITTLEDLINFAEGKKIKRDINGKRVYTKNGDHYTFEYEIDSDDNGNRPGIYLETKEPHLNPGIENVLVSELNRLGWNIVTIPANSTEQFVNKKVNVGNTNGKVVLQTFSHQSLRIIKDLFNGQIPTALLFWLGTGPEDMPDSTVETYSRFINIGVDNLAHFAGPSIAGGTPPDDWPELLEPWQAELIHSSGLRIHPYSFDNEEQMNKYHLLCEGMFTNQSDMTIRFYQQQGMRVGGPDYQEPISTLASLGY